MKSTVVEKAKDLAKYHVRLKSYQGPFDVLLDLIAQQEVNILDVDMEKLTGDYLKYLSQKTEDGILLAPEFLYVASLLLSIKTSLVLEKPEESLELPASREELLTRLKLLKPIKITSKTLQNKIENHIFEFTSGTKPVSLKRNLSPINIGELKKTYTETIKRSTPIVRGSYIRSSFLEISKAQDFLKKKLTIDREITLSELFKKKRNKIFRISIFFACLELCQKGEINIYQEEPFKEIQIEAL